jgi:hypothetical protein
MNRRQRAFLAAFRATGNVCRASEVADVGRSSHYRWLKKDPVYRQAFDVAKEAAADALEAEAYRRAVEGWDEPVGWYKGKAGGMVRRYSDVLLIFLLKGIRPEKYRERVELWGSLAKLNLELLPDALIERMARGEHPLSVLASATPELRAEALGLPPASSGERGEDDDRERIS